jgi:hypothetical protein
LPEYLTERNGVWQFVRRVPKHLEKLAGRGPVKHSTGVPVAEDRRGVKAGMVADKMNRDLEAYWRGLLEGKPEAPLRYAEARRNARTFGFDNVETPELTNRTVLERLEDGRIKASDVEAVLPNDETRPNQLKHRRKKNSRKKRVTSKPVPVQPIEPDCVYNLMTLAEAFADAKGNKITTVGTNSTGTASFYVELKRGKRSCTLRTYDRLTAWFSENWPEGHTMPKLKDPQH